MPSARSVQAGESLPSVWGRTGRRCWGDNERSASISFILVPLLLALLLTVTLLTYPKHPSLSLADISPELKVLGGGNKATAAAATGGIAAVSGPISLEGTTYFNITNPNFFQM